LELPIHTHGVTVGSLTFPINTDTGNIDTDDPDGAFLSAQEDDHYAGESSPGASMQVGSNASSITIQNAGGSQPHNNMQPYVGIHYIICLQGTFPSRN